MLKISYIEGKNGKPLNIRKHVGEKLKHYTVTQGACSDGTNIYMVFERKEPHRCKIVKLNFKTMGVVKVSGALKIGHGNDITYKDGVLYITHSKGSKVIHRVNAETLKKGKDIKVKIPKKLKSKGIKYFNGIACYGSGFILRVMGGAGMLIVNKNFKGTRYFKTKENYNTSQGMDQKGGVIYRAYSKGQSSDKNYLATFDKKGNLLKRRRVDVTGEMESVFLINGAPYGTVYRKKNVDGKMKYKAYIFKIG